MTSHRILQIDRSGPESQPYSYPRIRLQGRWLEEQGFSVDDQVKVTARNGQIAIEKVSADRLEFPVIATN